MQGIKKCDCLHKRRKFNYSTKTKAYKERCKDFKHRNFVNIVIFINDLPVIKRQRKFYYSVLQYSCLQRHNL
jgi:hypothetical protein